MMGNRQKPVETTLGVVQDPAMESGYTVWFTEDAGELLRRAGDHLGRSPVTSTVVTSTAQRLSAHGADDAPYRWFALVLDRAGGIAGVGMRTAPFEPWPPYLLAMPEAAAVALADAVLARDEPVQGGNGLRPAADAFAARIAEATGRRAEVHLHHRLFELGTLVEPRPVVGRLRAVRPDEADLALEWIHAFFRDADEQAGREAGHLHEAAGFGMADVRRKLADGVLWFWVDDGDRPVHLTGANPPAFGVTRIGPVYTPKPERNRGWAGAAVAEVSRRMRDDGHRVTLFTDQANPASNALYQALGYRPVVDTVQLGIG